MPSSTPTPVTTNVPTEVPAATATSAPSFVLSSSAFTNGEPIPVVYSCRGENISPPLEWTDPPSGTQTFALIVDDPDAPGTFVHWIVYDIPADYRSLPEKLTGGDELEDGMYQGLSSGPVVGYVGMCPPSKHHYSFKLYALDIHLEKKQGVANGPLQDAMQDHILAQSELIGTFEP